MWIIWMQTNVLARWPFSSPKPGWPLFRNRILSMACFGWQFTNFCGNKTACINLKNLHSFLLSRVVLVLLACFSSLFTFFC